MKGVVERSTSSRRSPASIIVRRQVTLGDDLSRIPARLLVALLFACAAFDKVDAGLIQFRDGDLAASRLWVFSRFHFNQLGYTGNNPKGTKCIYYEAN